MFVDTNSHLITAMTLPTPEYCSTSEDDTSRSPSQHSAPLLTVTLGPNVKLSPASAIIRSRVHGPTGRFATRRSNYNWTLGLPASAVSFGEEQNVDTGENEAQLLKFGYWCCELCFNVRYPTCASLWKC